MKRRISALALALLLAASVSPSASAAPGASVRDSLSGAAQVKFDEGAKLYKSARYAEAREAFLAAHASSGDARILFNVAVSDKALGRYARALVTLQRSLANPDRPLPAEYTRRAAEAIATLSRYVAFVTIETSVEGASVVVDGEPVRENPVALDTGEHTATATKEGYAAASVTFSVKAGEAPNVRLELARATQQGVARIACPPTLRCEVSVGERALGAGPVVFSGAAGVHVARATVDGRQVAEQTFELTNGAAIDVSLRAARLARLRVTSDRPGDLVTIDGRAAGQSGVEVALTAGEHHVALSRSDGTSKSLDVLLREDELRDLRVTLDAKRGTSPWWYVGGGAVLAGAATTAYLLSSNRSTRFEGSSSGTLNPYVVPASYGAPR